MQINQRVLINLLSPPNSIFTKQDIPAFASLIKSSLAPFSAGDLAEFYVDTGFLSTALVFLEEQHWLTQKRNPSHEVAYKDFVESFMNLELSPRRYILDFLKTLLPIHSKSLKEQLRCIEGQVLDAIKVKAFSHQKEFSTRVLNLIGGLFELEIEWQNAKDLTGEHLGLSMYRTFDSMDEVFNLNYHRDEGMKTELNQSERLYEGAGVGVQSGYSTVLTALKNLNPGVGSRFIDLGSGYGRLGVVIGLLRPDIEFKGYEFVQHRVDTAMATVKSLDLQGHVQFYTQDLSSRKFQIPDAEIYYLYDPFSEPTYRYVLDQLILISHRQRISIATKGNAKGWLVSIAKSRGWPAHQEFHSGNLCLFSSK